MLSGIFQKRKKIQELRAPTLQDIKRFRDVYARHAEKRHVETPSCFEKVGLVEGMWEVPINALS
ncbi:hypothetical protein PINS_up001699 [Pythium insidiosum]|nr:hypothetical protein PINS_up001699 [Pythium insidiosum]